MTDTWATVPCLGCYTKGEMHDRGLCIVCTYPETIEQKEPCRSCCPLPRGRLNYILSILGHYPRDRQQQTTNTVLTINCRKCYLLLVGVRFCNNVLKDSRGSLNVTKLLHIITILKCIRNVLNYFIDCIWNISTAEYIVNTPAGIFYFSSLFLWDPMRNTRSLFIAEIDLV